MKPITFLFVFIFLCLPSPGQTFALRPQIKPVPTSYSAENCMTFTRQPPNALTVAGIVMTCVGGIGGTITGIGGLYCAIYGADATDLWGYTAGGFGVALVGVGLIIAGTAHNRHKRWGIIAPKQNEIGVACSFR